MNTDGRPRSPQSWEHLLEKDPHGGSRFRLGILAAVLIHAGIFAITWPTIAQAPPAEPEAGSHSAPARQPAPHRSAEPELDQNRSTDQPPRSADHRRPARGADRTRRAAAAKIHDDPGRDHSRSSACPSSSSRRPRSRRARHRPCRRRYRAADDHAQGRTALHRARNQSAGIKGAVILDLIIDTEGRVESVKVLQGSPPRPHQERRRRSGTVALRSQHLQGPPSQRPLHPHRPLQPEVSHRIFYRKDRMCAKNIAKDSA